MSRARDTAEVAEEIDLKVDYSTPVNAQTGTTYTFALADAQQLTTLSSASAVTLTIPPQSDVAWGSNAILRIVNYGAGAVTVAGGSGVTVTNTATVINQYGGGTAIRTGSDTWTFVPFGAGSPPLEIEYLVIAGGGGGGANPHGGGGGAGGYRSSVTGENSGGGASAESVFVGVYDTTYTVTVGSGGAGGASNAGSGDAGTSGNNSVFATITSTGGGGGGSQFIASQIGGSGGGGSGYNTGSAGTSAQGYGGGNGTTYAAGGGGGAGAAGSNGGGNTTGGAGGAGVSSSITGSAITRSGGAGGASGSAGGSGGAGGAGGGGNGDDYTGTNTATAGTANTGGGGGGGSNPNQAGRSGGSGIVILRHSDAISEATTTGSPSVTTSGGYRIYTFTGSGTITWAA